MEIGIDDDERDFLRKQGLIITEIIARGGFGTILKVYSTLYKSEFAIKKVPETSFDFKEIECIKSIDDPRIVSLYSYFHYKGFYYMLMEYCVTDLERIVRDGSRISREEMFKYIQGIVLSVKACHDRNIAHCDIKPSNFMLDQYGRVKVGDFGLATLLLVDEGNRKIKGTRYFMAPEVITQKEYDFMKADIWAIGVTLYYLTTLTYPFYANDQDSLFSLIIKGSYRIDRISDPMLRHVILKCLETNPNDRPTIDQLIEMPYFKRGSSSSSEKVLSQAATKIIKPRVSSRKPKRYRSGVFSPSENQRVMSYLEMLKSSDSVIV